MTTEVTLNYAKKIIVLHVYQIFEHEVVKATFVSTCPKKNNYFEEMVHY